MELRFCILMLAGICAVSFGQGAEKQRPLLVKPPFTVLTTSEPEKLYEANKQQFAQGAEALAGTYKPGGRTNSDNAAFYETLTNAIKIFEADGNQQCLEIAIAMLRAATLKFYNMGDEQLAAQLDKEGAFNPSNIAMKEHCYDLALLYHLTYDKRAAYKAALVLKRYAEVIRDWPLRERSYQREAKGDPRYSQDDDRFRWRWDASGLYGEWIPGFVRRGLPLVYAFDLVYDSGMLEELEAREAIEQMLRYHIEFNETFVRTYGNLDHYALIAYPQYGILIPEPEYVHETVQWLDNLLHCGFYVSGFWHEGSPSYHKDITVGLTQRVPSFVDGYSDPPGFVSKLDGTRYDNLKLSEKFATQFKRMWESLGKVTLPNRICTVIHDTSFPQQAWWMPPKTHSNPKLLGCMGHVIMAKGEGANQQQAHLHFSGMHGHEHFDTLQIIAWNQGQEMISSTRYRPLPDDASTREWHSMAAGQNTVVIDETNQLSRLSSHRRKIRPEDSMGFPDPRYRAYGHGDSLTDGKLRFFAAQWAPVQMAEAEGEEAYHDLADLYRRTVAMVEIDEAHSYLVDVFRVRGGKRHDWMLHGCLEYPYGFESELDFDPIEGIQHKYIKNVKGADLDEVSSFAYVYENGKQSRHWLVMPQGSRLYTGEAPAMRRRGLAPFSFVRHDAYSSLFVAVHEFWSEGEEPSISSVQPMQMMMADVMDAGVHIELADGTRDLFVSCFDPNGETATICAAAGTPLEVAGGAVHVRLDADGNFSRAFATGISGLQVGPVKLTDTPDAYTGIVADTLRKESGDAVDALHTQAALPTDGRLNGAPVILYYGDELVQSFLIERIAQRPGGGSEIVLHNDAGISIEQNGELTKLHYFPGWAINGKCRFRIVNTVLAETGGKLTPHPKSDWPEPVEKNLYP